MYSQWETAIPPWGDPILRVENSVPVWGDPIPPVNSLYHLRENLKIYTASNRLTIFLSPALIAANKHLDLNADANKVIGGMLVPTIVVLPGGMGVSPITSGTFTCPSKNFIILSYSHSLISTIRKLVEFVSVLDIAVNNLRSF